MILAKALKLSLELLNEQLLKEFHLVLKLEKMPFLNYLILWF